MSVILPLFWLRLIIITLIAEIFLTVCSALLCRMIGKGALTCWYIITLFRWRLTKHTLFEQFTLNQFLYIHWKCYRCDEKIRINIRLIEINRKLIKLKVKVKMTLRLKLKSIRNKMIFEELKNNIKKSI